MLTWDYSKLAKGYINRPPYASEAIDILCNNANLQKGNKVCDIGAGAGHLTIELAKRELTVNAVEPNDAMRKNGIARTDKFTNVNWFNGTAEQTNQNYGQFDAVTFGSSFNVCNQELALQESFKLCKPNGWFMCMWNHRDLSDKIQNQIEKIISNFIPNYDYGLRRQDQTKILSASNLFTKIDFFEEPVIHTQTIADCVEAWRSHATLFRQTNENESLFTKIINSIEEYLTSLNQHEIKIPYITRMWLAEFKS